MKMKTSILSVLSLCVCGVLIGTGQAYAADEGFVSRLVAEFYNKTSAWEPTLLRYALTIFRWLLIMEVCFLGIKAALNRDQIQDIFKQFIMLILMAFFFLAVLTHYKEWSWQLINGLSTIGRELAPAGFSSESPFLMGMKLVRMVLDKLSLWSPGDSLALLIAALVIIVCFALISAQVVLIKCEAMVSMMASMLLVAFGSSGFLKDYAINALRYVLSVAFKLFVLQLVLGIGISFIEGFASSTAELQDLFVVIGASIVLLALVKSIPDVCAGIINGSHVSGGMALTSAAAAVGGAALGAPGALMRGAGRVEGAADSAAAAGSNLKSASALASLSGASGLGKVAHMGKELWSARKQAKQEREGVSTKTIMQERLAAARMDKGA